ncbi:xin actin-binding repeat-containing protein 1 [Dasypus novemcinctus]|uniref:xin actin-binding repeat-containing protein 1 n=1 Tax=Dasypus novemcinctus TaxID=9361 RepID=UPI0039C9E34C
MQVAPAPSLPMATAEDLPPPPPPALDRPLPPPKGSLSKLPGQREASELRRLYRHIHPELRKNLAEAVAEDLAAVLDAAEPTEGDVQCMRWIFENWRLDAIGDHEKPASREAASRRSEDGCGADVRAARQLFETKPLDELAGRAEAPEAPAREPAAGGDVQGTRTLFETRPLDRLGSRPSVQEQSPLELRSEIQELKGDVKKTVKLFQTEPLCAIQDAAGAVHEVKAACREEIQSNAVRSARWLFETRPLDAINRDPGQVRVIRGLSLEEGARPDVSAARWIFETQPLDAIREVVVDEKDFQPSPDLIPPGPDVRRQRRLFETCALDSLRGDEEAAAEPPAREPVIPGDVRSTLWLFETQPPDAPRDAVQVGRLQRVGAPEGGGPAARPLPHGTPQGDGAKGDVKAFKHLFETLPLDSLGQGEPPAPGVQPLDMGSPVYAMQDSRGQLHALTAVSREQVVGGDVRGCRWAFETQSLASLGRRPGPVNVVRGVTRQEEAAGGARWLLETQPLAVGPQPEDADGEGPGGPPPQTPAKGDVQTLRWLFETLPMGELAEKQGSAATGPASQDKVQSCTWMFDPWPPGSPDGSGEQHLQVSQVLSGVRQTEGHVFETEPPQAGARGRGPVRCCSRVEIPSGHVSRQKDVFRALEAGERDGQAPSAAPVPVPAGSVCRFTWLFENGPAAALVTESGRGGGLQGEPDEGPEGRGAPDKPETAAERTLVTLLAAPGVLLHGGVLVEARGPEQLRLARYVLPGPGQGRPRILKEELVPGELPRIVRQVLRRTDVEPQGLLVQEDRAGQLRLAPLRLLAPGGGEGAADLDPELQQWLACGLGVSVATTGLVMQETEQGLVALTAYSLQPRPAGRAERSSVQLLTSCIEAGDLSGLRSLRWEPPEDPGPEPAGEGREGAQGPPPTENIIHVPPLDPSVGLVPWAPQPTGQAVPPAREAVAPACGQDKVKQDNSRAGQKGTAATGRTAGTPDFQAAVPGPQVAAAEALGQRGQVQRSAHKQGPVPGAPAPFPDCFPQAPATAAGAAWSNTRPVAGRDPRTPAGPGKSL